MSPLVALLALACTAPLAVQTQQCKTVSQGLRTDDFIKLPSEKEKSVEIGPNDEYARINSLDNCAMQVKQLVGVDVTVCDDEEPSVEVRPEYPFSPIKVHRLGKLKGIATIHVVQYCARFHQ